MFKILQNLKFIKITATIAFTAASAPAWADMDQARQAFLQKQYAQALQLAVAAQAEAPYDA
jgi:cytochrome c556